MINSCACLRLMPAVATAHIEHGLGFLGIVTYVVLSMRTARHSPQRSLSAVHRAAGQVAGFALVTVVEVSGGR
jgi:hypothetical protein